MDFWFWSVLSKFPKNQKNAKMGLFCQFSHFFQKKSKNQKNRFFQKSQWSTYYCYSGSAEYENVYKNIIWCRKSGFFCHFDLTLFSKKISFFSKMLKKRENKFWKKRRGGKILWDQKKIKKWIFKFLKYTYIPILIQIIRFWQS